MTELKYLEEVLPAYRAGKKLEYYSIYHPKNIILHMYNKTEERLEWFLQHNTETILDKGWCVARKIVSWTESWEALKAGEKVKVDGVVYYLKNHLPGGTIKLQPYLYYRDPENQYHETCYGDCVPFSWLDRTDFEVLED